MASLQRSLTRLSVRRQRHVLGLGRSLFGNPVTLGDWRGPAVGGLVLVVIVAMCTDYLLARWREAPMLLGPVQLIGLGGIGALVVTAARTVASRALGSGAPEPRRLAAALQRELDVAAEPRAEVERLEVSAMRAFWLQSAQRAPWLLLDCGHDGWVLLDAPVDRHGEPLRVHQRWTIERLRWTHAILSLTSHGAALPPETLPTSAEAFVGLSACEVRLRSELPVAVQGMLPPALAAYR